MLIPISVESPKNESVQKLFEGYPCARSRSAAKKDCVAMFFETQPLPTLLLCLPELN